jgi:hypothetical protein
MFQNSANGRRQAALAVNVEPGPDALGEARDVALARLTADAVGSRDAC